MSFHHVSKSVSLTNNISCYSPSTSSSSLFQSLVSLQSLTAPLLQAHIYFFTSTPSAAVLCFCLNTSRQIMRQPKPRCSVTALYADERKTYVRLPGGSANLTSSSRCLSSPDSYWERLVHLQAQRCCPSCLSIGRTGNTDTPSV